MTSTKIESKIYEIRGQKVLLDYDIASLYEVETRVLNQAVKRNSERFPDDFMFKLTNNDYEKIKQDVGALTQNPSSQIVMMDNLPKNRTDKYLPFAFTEQGVAMLSGVLRSSKAISMNIVIMRAFVEVRRTMYRQGDLREQLLEVNERLAEHDTQLNHLYDAMENLTDEKSNKKKWGERKRIGY